MSTLVARWLALPSNLRGILWVGLSGFLFALLNVFTLIPAQHLNSYVMAFLRYCAGTLILMPLIGRIGPYRALHSNRKGLHITRGVIHACGMFLWFAAQTAAPSALRELGLKPPWNQPHVTPFAFRRSPAFWPDIETFVLLWMVQSS